MIRSRAIRFLTPFAVAILGIPTIAYWVSDNQRPQTTGMETNGALKQTEKNSIFSTGAKDTKIASFANYIPPPWPNGESPKAPIKGQPIQQVLPDVHSARRVEQTGPDISLESADKLLDVLSGMSNNEDFSKIRAAWELGNRRLSGWLPNEQQRGRIDDVVARLIKDASNGTDEYVDARSQLYRLWFLSHSGLIKMLDPSVPYDLTVKTLAATRNRELIVELISVYHSEKNSERKALLAFTLSCMREQRRITTLDRSVMSADESDRLYAEFISPALTPK